jgi:hypothetical protein
MFCGPASANIVDAIHKFDSTSLIMLHEQVYQNNSEWPPVTRNYLSRGGTVEAAFLMCVDLAMDQDARIGDGNLEEVMEQESSPLPRCRNDIEWDCMCEVLGYKAPRDPMGRYVQARRISDASS